MSVDDPQTDEEREQAVCFVVARREKGGRWRPYGVALGVRARDEMIAFAKGISPELEIGWVSLERAS